MTLLAFAAERRLYGSRSIYPAQRGVRRLDDGTDGQTDRRTLDSFIDLAAHSMPAVSAVAEGPCNTLNQLKAFNYCCKSVRVMTLKVIQGHRKYLSVPSKTALHSHRVLAQGNIRLSCYIS